MKNILLLLTLVFLSSPAFAQKTGNARKLQFRVLLGQHLATPSGFNEQIKTITANSPNVEKIKFNSIDLLWVFDNSTVLGARYDILEQEDASGPIQAKLRAERIDALLGWRFYKFEKGYLGLISHVALGGDKFNYDTKTVLGNSPVTESKLKATVEQGYGIGLEGAFYLEKQFPIGLEIGYTTWKTKEFTDSSGAVVRDSSSKDLQMDLSGIYFKMAIGFTFF